MTSSFPEFTPVIPETGLTEGDSYFAGRTKWTWRQPDLDDDGGYWEATDLNQTAIFTEILDRLTVIEAALNITPAEP